MRQSLLNPVHARGSVHPQGLRGDGKPLRSPPARRLGAMPFDLVEEHVMLRDLVAKFVDNELMPLEKAVMAREAAGGEIRLTDEELSPLLDKCRELGLWALDAPEEVGGMNLPAVALVGVNEELGRTITPFVFPPDSPNPPHAAGRRRRAPEEALHGALRKRRGAFRHRDLRAGRGRRPGGHDHPRGQGRRPLGHRRAQDLDQPRAIRRFHHRHGADRPGEARPRRHHRLHRREGYARLHRRARNPHARRRAHL